MIRLFEVMDKQPSLTEIRGVFPLLGVAGFFPARV
jgi:hypothetical protein